MALNRCSSTLVLLMMMMMHEVTFTVCGVSFPYANLTGVNPNSRQQPRPAPPAFSVVTLESHHLSSGKVIDCVRLHPHNPSSPPLSLEEAASQFPKAGSGWRKPTKAASILFDKEVPHGCSAHAQAMAAQRGDIFEDVTHINTPSDLQHAYALYSSVSQGFFTGGVAALSINKPYAQDGEVSLGQMWVITNRGDDDNYSTLEAGWMIHPAAFEDDDPRLFIYWTNDNYDETGCFNLLCGGFVQTSNIWTLGEKFPTGTSVPGDPNQQQYVLFVIFKDPSTGIWHLQLDTIEVGYWDPNIVTNFGNNYADELQFGGEVQIAQLGSPTQMGSGYFPTANFPWAASISFLRYLHDSADFNYFGPDELGGFVTNPNFYGLGGLKLDSDRRVDVFYYGGLGTDS